MLSGCTGGQPGANASAGNATNQSAQPPVEQCGGPVCGADNQTYATDCDAAVAGISILHSGACVEQPEPECSDSDGGLAPYAYGIVTKGNETHDDYSLDDNQLIEYTCLDNAIQIATVQCGSGKACEGGVCVEAPMQNDTQNATPVETGCTGPSENDIHMRQTVRYNGVDYTDSCSDYRGVKEYLCVDNQLESTNLQCPPGYGCMNGQCDWLQPTCSDTDDGVDTSKRGMVTVLKGYITVGEYTDECIDEGKLQEYSCLENGTATWSDELCPSGTKCYNDHCIIGECSENDGGKNIYRRGVTTDAEGTYEDDCLSDYRVREYYCYGDAAIYDDIDCDDDYICNGDSARCVEGSID